MNERWTAAVCFAIVVLLMAVGFANAEPQASGLHWARSANPVRLNVGDNLPPEYDAALVEAVADWNRSGVVELTIVAGSVPNFDRATGCYGDEGTIQACRTDAGANGVFGSTGYYATDGHIVRDGFYLNDYYLLSGPAPTPGPTASPTPTPTPKPCRGNGRWCRNNAYSVASTNRLQQTVCHELGHAIGLGHSSDPASCMVSGGSSTDPAPSDFASLVEVYSHLDPRRRGVQGGVRQALLRGGVHPTMNAMDRCPYNEKSGKHSLMAIIPEDHAYPLTLACTWCGMSARYPLEWGVPESLDNRTADEISAAVHRKES